MKHAILGAAAVIAFAAVISFAGKANAQYPPRNYVTCTDGAVIAVFEGQFCPLGWWRYYG